MSKIPIEYYNPKKSLQPQLKHIKIPSHHGWTTPDYKSMLELFSVDAMSTQNPASLIMTLMDLVHIHHWTLIAHRYGKMSMLHLTSQSVQWIDIDPKDHTLIAYASTHHYSLISTRIHKDPRGSLSKHMIHHQSHGCVIPLYPLDHHGLTDIVCLIIEKSTCHSDIVHRVMSIKNMLLPLIQIILKGSWQQQTLWSTEYMTMVSSIIPILNELHHYIQNHASSFEKHPIINTMVLDMAHHLNNVVDCYQLDTHTLVLHGRRFRMRELVERCLSLVHAHHHPHRLKIHVHGSSHGEPTIVGDSQRWIQIFVNLFKSIQECTSSTTVRLTYNPEPSTHKIRLEIQLTYYPKPLTQPWLYDRLTSGLVELMGGKITHTSSSNMHRSTIRITIHVEEALHPEKNSDIAAVLKGTKWMILTHSAYVKEQMESILKPWEVHVRASTSLVHSHWTSIGGVLLDTHDFSLDEQHQWVSLCEEYQVPIIGIGPCFPQLKYTSCLSALDHNELLNQMVLAMSQATAK